MTDRENIQTCHIVPQFYANGNQYAGALLANVEFVNGNLELLLARSDMEQPPENAVYCNCGTLIGFYTQVGDHVWLQVGALKLRTAHGKCAVCDTEYHFCASDKQLEQLIRRCNSGII